MNKEETADVGVTAEGAVSVVLLKQKVRGDCFVAEKGAKPQTLSWSGLCDLLAPHKTQDAMTQLRRARQGAYIGLVKSRHAPGNGVFFMQNPDRSGNIAFILRKDPQFEDRLVCCYRVEMARWPGQLTEVMGVSPRRVA